MDPLQPLFPYENAWAPPSARLHPGRSFEACISGYTIEDSVLAAASSRILSITSMETVTLYDQCKLNFAIFMTVSQDTR